MRVHQIKPNKKPSGAIKTCPTQKRDLEIHNKLLIVLSSGSGN